MVTTILGGLTALIPLLVSYLQIRAASEKFRLQIQIETYVAQCQDQDAKLRASGNPDSVAAADVMRDRALAASGILSRLPDTLPAANTPAASGSPSAVKAG